MTDDTTYDQQGLNVRLTGERSLNGAQGLGYPLDVRLDPAWPGLSGAVTAFVAELTTNMRQAAGSVRAAGAAVTTADTTGADAFDAVGSGLGGPSAGGSAGAGGAGGGSGSW